MSGANLSLQLITNFLKRNIGILKLRWSLVYLAEKCQAKFYSSYMLGRSFYFAWSEFTSLFFLKLSASWLDDGYKRSIRKRNLFCKKGIYLLLVTQTFFISVRSNVYAWASPALLDLSGPNTGLLCMPFTTSNFRWLLYSKIPRMTISLTADSSIAKGC